jgi:predicted aminopeptidase
MKIEMRKTAISRLLRMCLCAVGAMFLSSCYITSQGLKYLGIISRAQSIDSLLAKPDLDPKIRFLLKTASNARTFAIENIGLTDTKSYRSMAEVDGGTLVYVVQACAELSFDRYLWDYPFVGKLPYKGFFNPEDAKKEADRLKTLGYDVIVRPSDAFSTLGFLADPLFSFMKNYSEYDIADLVIHEMTHATVFVRGAKAGNFNEELATFVGRTGALEFIAERNGADSPEYRQALVADKDATTFASFLRGTVEQLQELYSSAADDAAKRAGKARIIAQRAEQFAKDAPVMFSNQGYAKYDMGQINNAVLDMYRLYESEPKVFQTYYEEKCGSNLRVFMEKMKAAKDPAAELGISTVKK